MAFIDDTQSRDTALFPVVIFETSDTTDDIHISTKVAYVTDGTSSRNFDPLLLSSPSIKESIDLENRKYKISNISLKVSNVEYNGVRFSDRISSHYYGGALNTECEIYWLSPSIENDMIWFGDDNQNAYKAYRGVIRAITHDEKTCNITLEDISQSELHRDVPIALLGTGIEVPSKWRNKPIPMVYGHVEKSPCVKVWESTSLQDAYSGTSSGIPDIGLRFDRYGASDYGSSPTVDKPPLFVYAGDEYHEVLENSGQALITDLDDVNEYQETIQYVHAEGSPIFTLPAIYKFPFTSSTVDMDEALLDVYQKNLICSRIIQCYREEFIVQWIVNVPYDVFSWTGYEISPSAPIGDSNEFLLSGVVSTNLDLSDLGDLSFNNAVFKIIFPTLTSETNQESDIYSKLSGSMGFDYYGFGSSYQANFNLFNEDGLAQSETFSPEDPLDWAEVTYDLNNVTALTQKGEFINTQYTFEMRALVALGDESSIWFYMSPDNTDLLKYENYFNIDFDDKDFYIDVQGRKSP